MCAKKYNKAYGIFIYDTKDVLADPIVLEYTNTGLACGPLSRSYIYLCKNLPEIAKTCQFVIEDLIKCDFYEEESYLQGIEMTDAKGRVIANPSLDDWTSYQTNRIMEIQANCKGILNDKVFRKLHDVISDYYLYESLEKVSNLSKWIADKTNNEWLGRTLNDSDSEKTVKKLTFPKDAGAIAKAINKVNTTF